jgi:hypothetical protein
MNTTGNDPESTPGLESLTKLATRTFLAGSVGLAVIGLGTGMAGTANAAGQQTLTCPATAAPDSPGTVTVTNYIGEVYLTDLSGAPLDNVMYSNGAPGATGTTISLNWPNVSGPQPLSALLGTVSVLPGHQQETVYCTVSLGATVAAPAPPLGGGGATPPQPPTCSLRPPSSCAGKPDLGPIQRQQ